MHVVPEAFAADFFLAFDQDFDIDGQLAGGLLQGVEGADVDMDLAFVVGGAAAEEIAAANRGLEGRRGPEFERLGRLDVVMAVEKDGGLAGRVQRFRVDQGMQLGRNDFDVGESGAAEAIGDPLGGALDVRLVLALRADAGNAQEFVEIGEMLVVLLFDVGVQLHCGSFMGRSVVRPCGSDSGGV